MQSAPRPLRSPDLAFHGLTDTENARRRAEREPVASVSTGHAPASSLEADGARYEGGNGPPRWTPSHLLPPSRIFIARMDQARRRATPGRMRLLAAIHPPDAMQAILGCLGLPSRAPPAAPPRSEDAGAGASWDLDLEAGA